MDSFPTLGIGPSDPVQFSARDDGTNKILDASARSFFDKIARALTGRDFYAPGLGRKPGTVSHEEMLAHSRNRKKPKTPLLHPKIKCKAVIASDQHVATRAFMAADWLDFTRHLKASSYIFNGDAMEMMRFGGVDFFSMVRDDRTQLAVVNKHMKMRESGTPHIQIEGNHDRGLRRLATDPPIDDLRIASQSYVETENNGRLLILHGDRFDWLAKCGPLAPLLHMSLTHANDLLMEFSRMLDVWRGADTLAQDWLDCIGFPKGWSAAYAVRSSTDGERYLRRHMRKMASHIDKLNGQIDRRNNANPHAPPIKKFTGIGTGHVHVPFMLTRATTTLYNFGCWVGLPSGFSVSEAGGAAVEECRLDNLKHPICTAGLLFEDGSLELVRYVRGVGIVPLEPREDGSGFFKNISIAEERKRRAASWPNANEMHPLLRSKQPAYVPA